MQLDAAANRLYFVDNDVNNTAENDDFYFVDLATGVRTLVSGATRGTGTAFRDPRHFVLEPAVNPTRAIVSNGFDRPLLSVDLATGDRTSVIAPVGTPRLGLAGALALDAVGSRLLAVNFYRPFLYAVPLPIPDPAPRTPISGDWSFDLPFTGRGPLWGSPNDIAVHAANRVAFLASEGINGIFMIDLVTGDRVIVSR
jgi:hypothetical protein